MEHWDISFAFDHHHPYPFLIFDVIFINIVAIFLTALRGNLNSVNSLEKNIIAKNIDDDDDQQWRSFIFRIFRKLEEEKRLGARAPLNVRKFCTALMMDQLYSTRDGLTVLY